MERYIAHEEVSFMGRERSITIRYDGLELNQPPFQSYSILRGKFDKWLAKQTEKKGAIIVNKTRVDNLIIDQEQVKGVVAGGEEIRAHVVIACDGVLSFMAQKAGLRQVAQSSNFAVGCKEVIELNRDLIDNRFNLEGNAGAARLFMGDVTDGKFGGGFLYTNKESISLGVVVGIDALTDDASQNAPELLERFKQRTEIARLIKGGQTVEYSAHVIPEGGIKAMGKLYGDGILVAGDAAGFSMNIGVTVRGMEYALASGYYAAKAVIKTKEKSDFSSNALSVYQTMLNDSFVMADFQNFKESLNVLEYPPLLKHYPELVGNVVRDLYTVPPGPKSRLYPTIMKYLTVKEIWGMVQLGRRMMKI